MHTHSH